MRHRMIIIGIIISYFMAGCRESLDAVDPINDFGTTASNVFLYYEDVEAAMTFYEEVLGLRVAADYGFAKIMRVAPKSLKQARE